MKIVIVTERFSPLYGGAETRYEEIAKHLAQMGHEVSIVTGRGDITSSKQDLTRFARKEDQDFTIFRIFDYKSGNIKPPTRSIQNSLLLGIHSSRFVRKLIKKDLIDVIEVNSIPHLHLPFISNGKKTPLVITWHEVWGSKWSTLQSYRKIGKYIELYNAQLGKERIAVSNFTARRLAKISLRPNHRINVIENGVSSDFFNVPNTSNENPHFIYVGRLIPEKNITTLLIRGFKEVLHQYPNAKLDIIGSGPLQSEVKLISKKYGPIIYHENVPHEKLLELYGNANIFVLPSSREGSGISAREANACGLPVVTVNLPNNAAAHETVEHYKNGLVCEPNNIGQAMINSFEMRDRLSKNAQQMAFRFHWEKIIPKLTSIYERVANR
ncbi:MAG: glycosyltransferase family 4 protein [Candidatus Kariarchaeaceae archaeon]